MNPIESEKVEGVRVFHDQLRLLIDAKIPICLESVQRCDSTRLLKQICDQFETHIGREGSIDGYFAVEKLPNAYRIALQQWLLGARTDALDRLTAGAEGQRYFKKAIGFVLLQASLIFGFWFVGIVCICLCLLPKMETIQADSFVEPGIALSWLSLVGRTLPYWAPLILATAFIAFLFRGAIVQRLMARIAPVRDDSFALTEFQGLFSRPARFQWLVNWVVVSFGVLVLLQALSVVGVTVELLKQLVAE